MSGLTINLLKELVYNAISDTSLRDQIVSAVRGEPHTITLSLAPGDIESLTVLIADLERISGIKGLDPIDAKSWAIGIFEIRSLTVHPGRPGH